jgi:hypothetical protein
LVHGEEAGVKMAIKEGLASLDAVLGRSGKTAQIRRTLHVERLEDRRLMYADNPLSGCALDACESAEVAAESCAAVANMYIAAKPFGSGGVHRSSFRSQVGRAAAIEQLADVKVHRNTTALHVRCLEMMRSLDRSFATHALDDA